MIFNNRYEAGIKISDKLLEYNNNKNVVVVAVARGGVEVAFPVCTNLKLTMQTTIARKIGAPLNPELAIGAVSEENDLVLNNDIIEDYNISQGYIESQARKEQQEIKRRLRKYRSNKSLIDLDNKIVIVIDDGIATGATMKVIIKLIKKRKINKLIIAVPVTASDTMRKIKKECDEFISLYVPDYFQAVGSFYQDFQQITDKQVCQLIKENEKNN